MECAAAKIPPMGRIPLACPVRGCGLALAPEARIYTCPRRHSFDIARSGYLNLLQPQDRRSPAAGDRAEVVAARARLIERGIGTDVIAALTARAGELAQDPDSVTVDLGSGTGNLLAAFTQGRPARAIGIDLSAAAAEHAARRFPDLLWVVANADRRLPLLDASVHLVFSLHARRNPRECARVLAPGGLLSVAVPGPDDLQELRAATQGRATPRDRAASVIAEHSAAFILTDRLAVRRQLTLGAEPLRDLLRTTYRGERTSMMARASRLTTLEVTFASDLLLFVRRS